MNQEHENNMRLIFRPTDEQTKRFNKIFKEGTDRYKTKSELLRDILNIGLDKLEEKH